MALQDVFAKVAQGLSGVANNPQASQEVSQWQQQRADQRNTPAQMAIQARSLAIGGLRQKLAGIDPQKDPTAYNATIDQIQEQIHGMREQLNPDQKLGAGEWLKAHTTDRLHITNHDARQRDLQARQAAGNTQDQQTAQSIGLGSPATPNPFVQKYNQAMGVPGATPEMALQTAIPGFAPKTEQEKFVRGYMGQHKGATEEDALKAYTDATTKDTKNPLPEIKPVEGGLGVETPANGTVYLMNQADDPSTPPKVRDALHSIRDTVKAKQDAADKKERDADERQMRSLGAIASRMGQSEQFQEQMTNFRSQLGEWKSIDQKAKDAQADYEMQAGASKISGNKSAFDQALIGEYARLSVPGARVTQAERQWAMQMGGIFPRMDIAFQKARTGELPDNVRNMYIQFLKSRSESLRSEADEAKPEPPTVSVGGKKKTAPAGDAPAGKSLADRLNEALQ